jgi:hypothetical protein
MDTCSTAKQPVAVSRSQLVRTSRKANAAYLMSTEQGMLSLKRYAYVACFTACIRQQCLL